MYVRMLVTFLLLNTRVLNMKLSLFQISYVYNLPTKTNNLNRLANVDKLLVYAIDSAADGFAIKVNEICDIFHSL